VSPLLIRSHLSNVATKKAQENLGSMVLERLQIKVAVTPTGLEQSTETRGKSASFGYLPPQSPPPLAITDELSELLRMWESMDDEARCDLLAVARGLTAKA
jgi:hypothetical protein